MRIVGILAFISMINTSESLKARKVILIFQHFSFYEQLKFHTQLSCMIKHTDTHTHTNYYFFEEVPEVRRAVSRESDCRSRGDEFDPCLVPYFREIDHEIISAIILFFPLIFKKDCQLQR